MVTASYPNANAGADANVNANAGAGAGAGAGGGAGANAAPPLTVLYDGACPLCRREIGLYRGLRSRAPLCFADVSDPASPVPGGTTRQQLLARFHVRASDGRLLSGAQAFLALWAALPGWRWLAQAGRVPGAAWAMERVYRLFLRVRPMLQRWAARMDRPA